MSVLTDYYNTGDDSSVGSAGSSFILAQTFTAGAAYTIVSIKLLLYRTAYAPGTLTIDIRTTSGGTPTSTILCTGTTDGNTLTSDTAGEWREITLGAGAALTLGAQYAISIYPTGGGDYDRLKWRRVATGAYSGGKFWYNNGSWSDAYGAWDSMFETYAHEPDYVGATGTIGITSGFSGVATVIEPTLATGSFSISSSFSGVGSFITLREAVGTIALTSYLLGKLSVPAFFEWVLARPPIYDNTKVFDDTSMTWVANDGRGGGRFQEQVLAIGQGSDGVSKIFVKVL